MKSKHLLLSLLPVAMALGTGWAVRGRFGHEQGAAWAGAIGALALILVAGRRDWYDRAFKIVMAGAFGWGISGVMSYGMIVGYGRATDFVNVYYGLLMLFVLGVLYGFLGGGLLGLALADNREKKVQWASVLTEMIAIGLLTYGVLINQLEWFMTPPRSEMWAACLGAGIALAWYIIRNGHSNVMRVAVWSALGGGFGFAFGNFLQVMGQASGIDFNFWNVMEYSIGFFGGAGMSYGTFTAEWPVTNVKPTRQANLIPIFFVALFVPFVVWDQSFVVSRFDFIVNSPATINLFQWLAIAAILFVAVWAIYRNTRPDQENARGRVREFFMLYFGLYIFLSFLITGVLVHPLEQYLYILNFIVILMLMPRMPASFQMRDDNPLRWAKVTVFVVGALALLAFIAMNSHEVMPGSQVRFPR